MTSSSGETPPWQIEPFRSAYLPALRLLFLDSRRATFTWAPAEQFQLSDLDEAIEGETIRVAVRGREPVGFVSWWPPGDFIHHLFVHPALLGRGIGTALLSECLAEIGRPARLKCLCANENALAFYQRRGWEIEKRAHGENGDYFSMAFRD